MSGYIDLPRRGRRLLCEMAPQLTFGKPVDFSADVPIFPPAAAALCALIGILLRELSGTRLQILPVKCSGLSFRMAVTAAVAAMSTAVLSRAGTVLADAGSGTAFTPVHGIATDGPYRFTRNPMYSGLVFIVVPGVAVLADTAWVLLMMAPLFAYLHWVVIAAEEAMLSEAFGDVRFRTTRGLVHPVLLQINAPCVWWAVHRITRSSASTCHAGCCDRVATRQPQDAGPSGVVLRRTRLIPTHVQRAHPTITSDAGRSAGASSLYRDALVMSGGKRIQELRIIDYILKVTFTQSGAATVPVVVAAAPAPALR